MSNCRICNKKLNPKYNDKKHMERCTKCYREDRQWGNIFKLNNSLLNK